MSAKKHDENEETFAVNVSDFSVPKTTEDIYSLYKKINLASQMESMEEMTQNFMELAVEVAGAEMAIFYLYSKSNDQFTITSILGDADVKNLVGVKLKKDLIVIEDDNKINPVIVGDLPSTSLWYKSVILSLEKQLENTIIVPIYRSDKLFGALQLFNFFQPDLNLIQVITDRLAIDLDRLGLTLLENQKNKRLRMMFSTMNELSRIPDREQFLRKVTYEITKIIDCERSSLFLLNEKTRNIGLNFSSHKELTPEKNTETAEEIFLKILRADSTGNAKDENLKDFGFISPSAITVPIITPVISGNSDIEERTIGGISAVNQKDNALNGEDAELIELFARHTGVILYAIDKQVDATELYLDVVKAIVAVLDAKDPYTQGHSLRVFDIAVEIGQQLALDFQELSILKTSSLFHDVGKIGIDDVILKKKGKLSPGEYDEIKKHPVIGANILRQIDTLNSAIPGILEHHERIDGSGYPYGLQNDEISLTGKIIAIADVFDAMTSDRPYRKGLSSDEALLYLIQNAGKLFDPVCVKVFSNILKSGKVF